jgi:uncharacterized membrane protein YfcA
MTFTAVALALAIGMAMGILGGGGSIIAVPAFTFLLHLPPKDAVVTSLAVVGLAATAGAIGGLLRGVVPIAVALTVGLPATLGAYGGAMAGARISDHVQLAILAAVMFVAAIALWREQGGTVSLLPQPSQALLAGLGLSIGVLTGLVGVGGGFLIVPALVIGARLPMQQAAAVSLFVIALAAFSGLAGYGWHATPAWAFIVPFAAIAAAGTLVGATIASRLPQRRLQQAFAASLVLLGSYVLVQL